jgi:hypothetical protein
MIVITPAKSNPVKAGNRNPEFLDSRFRRNDKQARKFLLRDAGVSTMKKVAELGTKCNESALPHQPPYGVKTAIAS